MRILTLESNNGINWFSDNKMIANLDKFKSIVIQKNKPLNQPTHFMIENNKVDIESSVKLLVISIDNQLSFSQRITKICKSTSSQLNTLGRLKTFLGFKAKNVSISTFILSIFSYSACFVHLIN